jgi:hypothetical protein
VPDAAAAAEGKKTLTAWPTAAREPLATVAAAGAAKPAPTRTPATTNIATIDSITFERNIALLLIFSANLLFSNLIEQHLHPGGYYSQPVAWLTRSYATFIELLTQGPQG